MKKRLVIVAVSIFLLTGCGSDDDSDKKEKKTFSDLSKISLGFNQSSRLEQNQNSRVTSNKMSYIINKKNSLKGISIQNKMEEYSCEISGTYDMEVKDSFIFINYKNCIELDTETGLSTYTNGEISFKSLTDTDYKVVMKNYFYSPNASEDYYFEGDSNPYYTGWSADVQMDSKELNGIESMSINGTMTNYIKDKPLEESTYTNFISKNNKGKKSWYFEGSITFKVSCYSEVYTVKTKNDAWLVENSDNPDYYTKGAIDVNNIRYSYNGTEITLSTQEEEETFDQKELSDKLEENIANEISNCSIH